MKKSDMGDNSEQISVAQSSDSVGYTWPVIDRSPKFTKVINNFGALDYIGAAMTTTYALGGLGIDSMSSIKISKVQAGGALGVTLCGLLIPYCHSLLRLKGYVRNDEEVARYNVRTITKPRPYPIIDPLPKFTDVVRNFGLFDYVLLLGAGPAVAGTLTLKEFQGISPKLFKGRLAVTSLTGGLIGLYFAYMNSAGKFKGYVCNDSEVAQQKKQSISNFVLSDDSSDKVADRY